MNESIKKAGETADKLAKSWNATQHTYSKFGSDFFKKNRFSPDAVLQQVFQLAYRKMHNVSVSQYCVAATMAFKAGRNDRVRSNTPASKKFIDAVVAGELSKNELREVSERSETGRSDAEGNYLCGQPLK